MTSSSFQGVVIVCVPVVSVCSGIHWRMNVSRLTVCPVQRCFAKENRGSDFTESLNLCHSDSALQSYILITYSISIFITSQYILVKFICSVVTSVNVKSCTVTKGAFYGDIKGVLSCL